MGIVQRWYIYLVSAITLQALTWAVISLFREMVVQRLKTPIESLALMIAVIVVGLPLYLVHWIWAQRNAAGDPEERASIPRLLYLYLMMALFLAPIAISAFGLLKALLHLVFGVSQSGFGARQPVESLWFNLIAIVVLSLLWFYHRFIRSEDEKVVPKTDASSTVRQLYVYAFAATGLLLTGLGSINLILWITTQLDSGPAPVDFGRLYIADVIARLIIGIALWLPFWLFAQRLYQGPEERERTSILRKIYLYLIVFVSVMAVIISATLFLSDLLSQLFNVSSVSGGNNRTALSVIVVSGLAWAYHAYVLRKDVALTISTTEQAMVRRVYLYLVAAVGLASVLVGVVGVINVFIRAVGGSGLIVDLRQLLAIFIAMLIAGLPVWLVNWRRVQIAAADPGPIGQNERSSLVRRIYLYLFLFAATMTILFSAVYVVWQALQLVLGVEASDDFIVNLAQALSFILVAMALWIYHGVILRRESQRVKQETATRLKPIVVAVIDDGDGSLGKAVIKRVSQKVPSATILPIALGPAAQNAIGNDEQLVSPAEILSKAEVIVGPWHMAVAGSAGGLISDSIASDVVSSSARKVLIPTRDDGWEWAGTERWNRDNVAKQVTSMVKQLASDQEVKSKRGLSVGAIAVIILVSLCLLTTVLPPILGGIIGLIFP